MTASLPWYPFRQLEDAYALFWSYLRTALRDRDIDAPDTLAKTEDFRAHWATSDLLLSQCCGYHIATKAQKLEAVGVPHFLLKDIKPGQYKSVIVARKSDPAKHISEFRGRRAAFNEDQSYSGHTALLGEIPEKLRVRDFFSTTVPTGSHICSMEAVAKNQADVAAIDQVSFGLISEGYPDLAAQLHDIGKTKAAQAPPYVTSSARPEEEIDAIRDALVTTSRRPEVKSALEAMRIRVIIDATNEDYLDLAKEIMAVEKSVGL